MLWLKWPLHCLWETDPGEYQAVPGITARMCHLHPLTKNWLFMHQNHHLEMFFFLMSADHKPKWIFPDQRHGLVLHYFITYYTPFLPYSWRSDAQNLKLLSLGHQVTLKNVKKYPCRTYVRSVWFDAICWALNLKDHCPKIQAWEGSAKFLTTFSVQRWNFEHRTEVLLQRLWN